MVMKKAKFASVTAALLVRDGEARCSDGNAHADATTETVDLLSGRFQQVAKDAANDKSAEPTFSIGASLASLGKLRLSQSDYEEIDRLIAAKLTLRSVDPDKVLQFGSGTKTESAPLSAMPVWLKALLSGFQALARGNRL